MHVDTLRPLPDGLPPLQAAVFDFDGTISTLRHGWEGVMGPMMCELLAGDGPVTQDLRAKVDAYLDQSAGLQTIVQMQWLNAQLRAGGGAGLPDDPWYFKGEYNRRLMEPVNARIEEIRSGRKGPEHYLVRGALQFVAALREKGVRIHVASGTDDPDVRREAAELDALPLFDSVDGAPVGRAECSKEAVMRRLLQEHGLSGSQVLVVGDGKVEIALGRAIGARTLGVASDEERGLGMNQKKYARLKAAGADVIVDDFSDIAEIARRLRL